MTVQSDLSKIILPFIEQFQAKTLLLAGETAITLCNDLHDTRSFVLTTPFKLEQLDDVGAIHVAIISDLIESSNKTKANEWLGILRNRHTQHIIVISNKNKTTLQDWQFADFLALGLKKIANVQNQHVYAYAIENYHEKRDWLNSRFWANPENYNKYRW